MRKNHDKTWSYIKIETTSDMTPKIKRKNMLTRWWSSSGQALSVRLFSFMRESNDVRTCYWKSYSYTHRCLRSAISSAPLVALTKKSTKQKKNRLQSKGATNWWVPIRVTPVGSMGSTPVRHEVCAGRTPGAIFSFSGCDFGLFFLGGGVDFAWFFLGFFTKTFLLLLLFWFFSCEAYSVESTCVLHSEAHPCFHVNCGCAS